MVLSMTSDSNDQLWRAINGIDVRVAVLEDRWTELRQRQSQIPTWVWLSITVLLTLGLWLADKAVLHVP